jgi:hypothetical protein
MLSTVKRLFSPQPADAPRAEAAAAPEFPGATEHDREIAAAESRRDQARAAAEKERAEHGVLVAAVKAAQSAFEQDPSDENYSKIESAKRDEAKRAVFVRRAEKLAADAESELEQAREARKQALLAHLTERADRANAAARVDQLWDEHGAAAIEQLESAIRQIDAVIDEAVRAAQRASIIRDGDKQARLENGAIERTAIHMNELRNLSAHVRRRFRQEVAARIGGIGGLPRWIDV